MAKQKYLTVGRLASICKNATNEDAVVCLSIAGVPYAMFVDDFIDKTHKPDDDGNIGNLFLRIDTESDISKMMSDAIANSFLTGEPKERCKNDDD